MRALLVTFAILSFAGQSRAQAQQTSTTATSALPPERFLYAVGIPAQASPFLKALPGMFDQAGHERRVLTGIITQGQNNTPFLFTRELDQKVRLDIGTVTPQDLIATQLNTLLTPLSASNEGGIASWYYDVLELLADDSPEGLLFSFGTGAKVVWLGGNYRVDAQNPNGPAADVYAKTASAGTQPGTPKRTKLYLFDSGTKLLSFTRYQIESNGASLNVEISFTGWTSMAGQMVPTTITRTENGQTAFSLSVTSVASGPAQVDSLFSTGS